MAIILFKFFDWVKLNLFHKMVPNYLLKLHFLHANANKKAASDLYENSFPSVF